MKIILKTSINTRFLNHSITLIIINLSQVILYIINTSLRAREAIPKQKPKKATPFEVAFNNND